MPFTYLKHTISKPLRLDSETLTLLQHVTLYACPNSMGLSLGLIQDVFAMASLLQEKEYGQAISISLTSLDGLPITSFSGMTVTPDIRLDEVEHTDLVILHAMWGEMDHLLSEQAPLYDRLKTWHKKGVPILAVTTGAFLLAESGLLDNRMATTHWHKQKEFAQRYPQVNIQSDRFITATGELYTCAGTNAGLEIMVHLLGRLSNKNVSKAIEDTFLADFKRSYTGEFPSLGQQTYHDDEAILAIQQWLEIHFSETLTLHDLAHKANMSLRTFKRRFKEASNEAPLSYIQNLRLEQGKEYLRHTNKTVAEISWLVGYEDPGHFNRLFKRKYGQTAAKWKQNL